LQTERAYQKQKGVNQGYATAFNELRPAHFFSPDATVKNAPVLETIMFFSASLDHIWQLRQTVNFCGSAQRTDGH
jgi:hypothetical protein